MLISLVTVTLNDLDGLMDTYHSVRKLCDQCGSSSVSVEWLVVDGGSSFETLEQKRQFDDIASRADWFISETDNGI